MTDKEAAARQWLNWHDVYLKTEFNSREEREAVDMMQRIHHANGLTYDDICDARLAIEGEK